KGPGVKRPTAMAPITCPALSIGTASPLRWPVTSASCANVYSGSSRIDGICATAFDRMARPSTLPRSGRAGGCRRLASSPRALKGARAARCTSSPSKVTTLARSLAVAQPHRRAGDGVEDWLHVRQRARYHTQDLAARPLLLVRLG